MMTSREIIHQAIDELSEAEAGIVLETFTDRRKHEAPGLALREAFVEAYRIRNLEEGLRMEKHPGIVFRNGTGGRSATLSDGPEVWKIVETLKGTELMGQQAIAAITTTAEWGALTARTDADRRALLRRFPRHEKGAFTGAISKGRAHGTGRSGHAFPG